MLIFSQLKQFAIKGPLFATPHFNLVLLTTFWVLSADVPAKRLGTVEIFIALNTNENAWDWILFFTFFCWALWIFFVILATLRYSQAVLTRLGTDLRCLLENLFFPFFQLGWWCKIFHFINLRTFLSALYYINLFVNLQLLNFFRRYFARPIFFVLRALFGSWSIRTGPMNHLLHQVFDRLSSRRRH